MKDLFCGGQRTGFEDMEHDFCQTIDKGHGRIEIRRCWTIGDPEQLSYVETGKEWPGLSSIGLVTAERREGEQVSVESRYYTPAWSLVPAGCSRRPVAIGASRIASTGCWTCPFERTKAG